jgi:hypothetical protein
MAFCMIASFEKSVTCAAGDRPDAKDVLVVLTDGISINPTHTADQAYIFKERHIKVISIGIGRGANKQELIDMAVKQQ